jgi:uncharacterized protein YxjI
MSSAFDFNQYVLKRQVLALGGKFRVYAPGEKLVLYVEQKLFKLREDIRVYSDESKAQEVLIIKARQIIDFSAAYDVMDSSTGQKVGAMRRKGLASMLRDEWEVLDVNDNVAGKLFEDSMGMALLRRFLSNLIPQDYDLLIGLTRVADFKQNFNPFTYHLNIDFSMDTNRQLDRRMGLAAGILLAAIEGRQQ